MNMNMNELFFQLIQVAIGTRICLSHTPSADEWGELYAMAKKQSLVGVCFTGVQRLGANADDGISAIGMPEMLYFTWMGMAAKIQQRNEVVNAQCVEVQQMIEKEGFRTFIMKGQGTQPYIRFQKVPSFRRFQFILIYLYFANLVTSTSSLMVVLRR